MILIGILAVVNAVNIKILYYQLCQIRPVLV